jgi:hypothetical protein
MSVLRRRKYAYNDLAAYFDGASSFDVGNDILLNMTSAMTAELWIKPSLPASAYFTLFRKDGQYLINCSDTGMIRPHINIGGVYHVIESASGALTFDAWSHIAMVYDGAALTGYLNGTQFASTAVTGELSTTTNQLLVGVYKTEKLKGHMDDFRIWGLARTQAEIEANKDKTIHKQPGLAASWLLDGNLLDSTGNNLNGSNKGITFDKR